jgi:hypothetical protein
MLGVLGTARADDLEVVHTTDGSVYRGELVERVVNDHITLKLATGETRRLEWKDIAPSEAANPSKAPASPAEVKSAPTAPPNTLDVTLTVNDGRAVLQRSTGTLDVTVGNRQGHADSFENVCAAPCGQVKVPDSGGRFRVGGEGLVPTATFALHQGAKNQVDASMAATSKRTAGQVLTWTVGVPVTLLGATLFLLIPATNPGTPGGGSAAPALFFSGLGVTTVGVAALVTGVVLWVSSSSSVNVNGNAVSLRLPGRMRLDAHGLSF